MLTKGDTNPLLPSHASVTWGGHRVAHQAPRSHAVVLITPDALTPHAAKPVLKTTLNVLTEHDVCVGRWLAIRAPEYLHRGYLAHHYPRLHRIANEGQAALSPSAQEALRTMTDRLNMDAADVITPLDAFAMEPLLTPEGLDHRVRAHGAYKLGAAAYATPVAVAGRLRLLLNGFVPAMSLTYLDPATLVIALEIATDHEIAYLRTSVLGNADPTQATMGTLRQRVGQIVRDVEGRKPAEGRNGVHLSAGHLAGMFHVWSYVGAAAGEDLSATALGSDLARRGIHPTTLRMLANDPDLNVIGEAKAAMAVTEHASREEVLDIITAATKSPTPRLPL